MRVENACGSAALVTSGAWLALVLAGPAAAQETSRVSIGSGGAEGDDDSFGASISSDGRYAAFESNASNLVGGDTNGSIDVFVHDRESGVLERVSVDSGGAQGNDGSNRCSISADGRYVTFESWASNLVAGDTNGTVDVFVRDRQSGTTERVSVATGGAQGNSLSIMASISADGRYVAFASAASDLVAGDTNVGFDVFVHDRQSGTTERVSVDSAGTEANASSFSPSISADGRHVAFDSDASNLVGGDTNVIYDVFVHDRQSGVTERVSVDSNGAQGDDGSSNPSLSADGRFVAFESLARNLGGGDTNAYMDIFVHDRQSSTTERASADSAEMLGDDRSFDPSISADGRYVVFESDASNFVGGDTNAKGDVFVRDRESGTTERVSVDSAWVEGNGFSFAFDSSISSDGRYVAFWSYSSNLDSGDTNGSADVFVRDRSGGIGAKYCTATPNSGGGSADILATGSASSGAGDLVLTSRPVPNQNGIFFHGANQALVPFGNGFLCTTGAIARGVVVLAAGNVATYAYDNADAKHSLAGFVGTTRNFQHWFRDAFGGGALFNTSTAISILVQP